jgi:hypothetical protein
MIYGNTYKKNWESTQRLIYDLFSQIVRLKKTMSKGTLFCFNAASGTLLEDLRTLYCCR